MEQLGIDRGELISKKKRPNLNFEEGSYTLPELLESHLLPVVAQYDVSRQPIPFHEFNFDLSQPLLLYKKRHIQKVSAHSLYINEDNKYEDIGESILIPEDYKGWFAVLQRLTGYTKADDAVPHFTTIEELANSNTDRFLVGGTKKINGIQISDATDSLPQKHDQRQFLPGDILTRDKIYYGETKKKTRLFRKAKYITEKFLKCRDESDREILLPFEQAGIFYQVSHKYGKPTKNVMQMSDIVARKLTPRIVKLVFGKFPITHCSFTGLMRAESSNIETSIIAATMNNTKNLLMEIPVSSAIYFRVANMDSDLRRNECYRNAMSICVERAITYMRNIKVCYNFTLNDDASETEDSEQKGPCCNDNPLDESEPVASKNDTDQSDATISNTLNENSDIFRHDVLRSQLQRSYFKAMDVPRVFSVDIPDEVCIRPGRCRSTGRMSFCLGNNYLTVPMLEPSIYKRNSGNNNTIHEISCTTKRGSRISFNGTFFKEESGDEDETGNKVDKIEEIENPPPIPCTNINSYVNINPATDWNPSDFGSLGRQCSQPPDIAPPPLPRSSSTSGVSTGSTSSSSDSNNSNHGSRDSFEYAVPKFQESLTTIADPTNMLSLNYNDAKKVTRRPSTFTFSEGAVGGANSELQVSEITIDEEADDNEPIYENIKSLMELVSKLDESELQHNEAEVVCTQNAGEEKSESNEDSAELDISGESLHLSDSLEANTTTKSGEDTTTEEVKSLDSKTEEHTDLISDISHEVSDIQMVFNCEVSASLISDTDCLNNDDNENENNSIEAKTSSIEQRDSSGQSLNDQDNDIAIENKNTLLAKEFLESFEHFSTEMLSQQKVECGNECKDSCTNIKSNTTVFEQTFGLELSLNNVSEEEKGEKHVVSKNGSPDKDDENTQSQYMCRKALENFKHSEAVSASKSKIRALQKPFRKLTVDEISEALITIGIKGQTIEQIKALEVNGAKLTEVLEGELSIRDCLSGVNLVDQQKISMFIRGWRPNSPD
ncbi:hypothetical protein ACF0H5_004757 [Mactra antiquata]